MLFFQLHKASSTLHPFFFFSKFSEIVIRKKFKNFKFRQIIFTKFFTKFFVKMILRNFSWKWLYKIFRENDFFQFLEHIVGYREALVLSLEQFPSIFYMAIVLGRSLEFLPIFSEGYAHYFYIYKLSFDIFTRKGFKA